MPSAKAAADTVKAYAEDEARKIDSKFDIKGLSHNLREELDHATHVLAERTKEAEARIRRFADHAGDDLSRISNDTRHRIEENPVPAVLIAAGVGFALGLLLTRRW